MQNHCSIKVQDLTTLFTPKLGMIVCSLSLSSTLYACGSATQWLCEIGHGIIMAESQGKNALLLSGYAYHTSVTAHWPTGVAEQTPQDQQGLNEIPYGSGYGRSWYNSASHEEYTLFAIAFSDSYWKPETHIGYLYQKYHPILANNDLELGLGYSPQMLIKPSWTNDSPLILPFIGLSSSLRYKKFELIATWANVIFVNAKWIFN